MICYKFLCLFVGIILGWSVECDGQKSVGVDYRNYSQRNAVILDSLKQAIKINAFKGIHTLKREFAEVQSNQPVEVKMCKVQKRKLNPDEIVGKRRGSILTVNKFLHATTQPEVVTDWATAVVLSEDGVCVTNYHVFWQLLDSTGKLGGRDSLIFVATEAGKVYPITELLSYNKTGDFAFFKINTKGDKLTPMPIGEDLSVGEEVHLLSNPEGYPYVYMKGIVTRTIATEMGNPFGNRMEMSADFAKGSSGAPIMDNRGNMVGMVSCIRAIYYSTQPPYYLQMNVKMCVPISVLQRVVYAVNG